MEVHLLRDLLNQALHEPCEKTRVGNFWVLACPCCYEKFFPLVEFFFIQETMEWVANEECKIIRVDGDFLIEDAYGSKDIFSPQEISCIVGIWKKVLEIKPNIIDFTEEF